MGRLALTGGGKMIADERRLRSRWKTANMDEALREYTGAKFVQMTNSGTGALISCLLAAGIGPGDEVITVAYTWTATVGAILRVNAVPVFADIDPQTLTIDVADVRRKITPQTKAILPVDFYGHPAPIPELMAVAHEHHLFVIEDACQASTAEIDGQKVGSIADMTAFSFSGKPIYTTYGGGGAYLTNDRKLFERGLLGGQHPTLIAGVAQDPDVLKYASMGGTGDNFRNVPNDGMMQLLDADARTNARIANCDYLTSQLEDVPGITTPYVRPGYKHVYHYYTCLWDPDVHDVSRDRFCEALNAEGLFVVAYLKDANYRFTPDSKPIAAGGPIHLRTIFRERNLYGKGCPFQCPHVKNPPVYAKGDLPVSEAMADREFCIGQPDLSPPCDDRDMRVIVDTITKVIDNIDELR